MSKLKNVLVVDDDVPFLSVVHLFADFNDAIEALFVSIHNKHRALTVPDKREISLKGLWTGVDVIYIDYNMPGMNGDQLLSAWEKEGLDLATVRVIGISSDPKNWKVHKLCEHVNPIDVRLHIRALK